MRQAGLSRVVRPWQRTGLPPTERWGRRPFHPAEPAAISKDHSLLLTPTGGGAASPPRSAADRCPCPNAGECSHASKEASSRQRASSSPLSAGTVIALIFTTVICPMMPAHLIADTGASRPAAALQPGPRSATAARAAPISVRRSWACRVAIWACRPARPSAACRSPAVQPATSWLMAAALRRMCSAASLLVTAIAVEACPALSASSTSEFTVTAGPAERPAVRQAQPGQGDPAERVVPLLRPYRSTRLRQAVGRRHHPYPLGHLAPPGKPFPRGSLDGHRRLDHPESS